MLSEAEFDKRRLEMLQVIEVEVQRVKAGQSKRFLPHLELILKELQESTNRNITKFQYPYFIIDSWDYNDPLANDLMDLANAFKEMRKG